MEVTRPSYVATATAASASKGNKGSKGKKGNKGNRGTIIPESNIVSTTVPGVPLDDNQIDCPAKDYDNESYEPNSDTITIETPSPVPVTQPPPVEEESAKMPPGKRPPPPKRDTEVGELLTLPQRNELVTLITTITDAMRDNVTRSFDFPPIILAGDADGPNAKALNYLPPIFDMMGLKIDSMGNARPSPRSRHKRNQDAAKLAPLLHNGTNPLTPTLEGLKRDTLANIRRWQSGVTKRVSELVVARTGPGGNPHPSAPNALAKTAFKGAPSMAKAGAGPGVMRPIKQSNGMYSMRLIQSLSCFRRLTDLDSQSSTTTDADAVLLQLYAPAVTALSTLPMPKRRLILHSMLMLLLSLDTYTAYSRTLMLYLATSLQVPPHMLGGDEVRVANGLSRLASEICIEDLQIPKRGDEKKDMRRMRSETTNGGLLPPLAAAGFGSAQGGGASISPATTNGLLGPMAYNNMVVGTLFGIYGTRGAGKMVESYTKDVSDFAFLPLYPTSEPEFRGAREVGVDNRRLRAVFCVNGWVTQMKGLTETWEVFGSQGEVYGLRWEADSLVDMGKALVTVARSKAWSEAKRDFAARRSISTGSTAFQMLSNATVYATLGNKTWLEQWPPSLLKLSKIVDNIWGTCMVRADKTGSVLAEALMSRVQGERGVTLVGYSLGARVIYNCLMTLVERRMLGIVENVVIMGAPVSSDSRVWSVLRSAVSGRLINVYSENDYMLAFLVRHGCVQFGIAGLQCIDKQNGVENVNASALITNHLRYQYLVGTILKNLGWEDIDGAVVVAKEEELRVLEDRIDYDKRMQRYNDELAAKKREETAAKDAAMAKENGATMPSTTPKKKQPATRIPGSKNRKRN
ncbi:hypothetical protein MCOR27_002706 [Pyricularia oryzae]|uniref:Transmembrane and coiled-coil domain-containing protein 4 n=1 Tax=Pyricularia grisea TaxID=148305 RepID=A0ABQ8NUQ0_PYRGI|nr:hypothetical protein MCOR19_003245 [Pyricularia oryzae]KAI6302373.1 hypothetical protein MCOR33_002272 [Pyricularia grisea]KAI6282067.1 hypothetical protein MCOR26_003012 [Pyricularia oryzae]KAI6284577.1 hypothetical protein MCOR27_002706 [Pyricularia oryzae]KAI6323494.1 hypothetical protein MCOR29_004433 [Pyricularia oryzae]